jgi:replicative superfamily II helicase
VSEIVSNKNVFFLSQVVVFVNSEADAIHTAETIRNATCGSLKYKLTLSDRIKKTLLKFMTESTSEECKYLCLEGYLVIHSEMTVNAQ